MRSQEGRLTALARETRGRCWRRSDAGAATGMSPGPLVTAGEPMGPWSRASRDDCATRADDVGMGRSESTSAHRGARLDVAATWIGGWAPIPPGDLSLRELRAEQT